MKPCSFEDSNFRKEKNVVLDQTRLIRTYLIPFSNPQKQNQFTASRRACLRGWPSRMKWRRPPLRRGTKEHTDSLSRFVGRALLGVCWIIHIWKVQALLHPHQSSFFFGKHQHTALPVVDQVLQRTSSKCTNYIDLSLLRPQKIFLSASSSDYESFVEKDDFDERTTLLSKGNSSFDKNNEHESIYQRLVTDSERASYIQKLVHHQQFDKVDAFLQYGASQMTNSSFNTSIISPSTLSFMYTTAMAAMAKQPDQRHRIFPLFDRMQNMNLMPSVYTFSALFHAIPSGSEDALSMVLDTRSLLVAKYPSVRWTIPVYEAAILACARCETPDDQRRRNYLPPTNNNHHDSSVNEEQTTTAELAWSTVQQIRTWMKQESVDTSYVIYLALLRVSQATRNKEAIMELKDEMIHNPLVHMDDARLWAKILQSLASNGYYEETFAILIEMGQDFQITPNVRHCTLHLKALSLAGMQSQAVSFLEYMAGFHKDEESLQGLRVPAPDEIAVLTVLSSCANTNNYELTQHVFQGVKQGVFGDSVKLNEQMYNCLLSTCTEPAEARALIREMRLTRRRRRGVIPPSLLSYTKAMVVCRKAHDLLTALALLEGSKHDGLTPDTYLYSAAIWTAADVGDCDRAYGLFEQMKGEMCEPTVVSFNGLITALISADRLEEAIDVFQEMKEAQLDGTWVTFQKLSLGFRNLTAPEKVGKLQSIYKCMTASERKAAVSGPILSDLIASYGSMGDYDKALSVFESIEGPSNAACLRAVLFACSNASPPEWEEALGLLHTCDVVGNVMGPAHVDAIAVSNTILACSKADKWDEALQLLRLYGGNNTSLVAFNALIASCGRCGRPDMAIEVLNEMDYFDVLPDSRSFRLAIIACNQAQHRSALLDSDTDAGADSDKELDDMPHSMFEWWECALSLLRRMQENGLKPDIQTYSSVISACESAGKWQRALSVLQSLMDKEGEDKSLNVYCFNAAISACEKGGAWVEALELYERMKAHPSKAIKPNQVTMGGVIQALDAAGQKELIQEIYNEGLRRKILQPWRYTLDNSKSRIRALDLHYFSAALARAAMRDHIESLLDKGVLQDTEDFVIIIGKGLRSTAEPVLKKTAVALLNEYGIAHHIDAENPGRIIVRYNDLADFVSKRTWR